VLSSLVLLGLVIAAYLAWGAIWVIRGVASWWRWVLAQI
jgi:hypothetical protein